jgi:hypothetical protein
MEKVENLHIYTRQWFKAVDRSDIPSGSDRVDNLQIQTGLIYLKVQTGLIIRQIQTGPQNLQMQICLTELQTEMSQQIQTDR